MEKTYDQILEGLAELTSPNSEGSWRERRDAFLAYCNEEQRTALEEFVGWFDELNQE
jgi:hypothetical protein